MSRLESLLRRAAEGAADWDSTGMPREIAAAAIDETIVAADICWEHDPGGAIRPSAIRLDFRRTTVWIAAGCSVYEESLTSFRLGTNDVMVVFTQEMSSQIGIPESRPMAHEPL